VYEAVHAHPDGESTVARFALTAASDGFDGVVVRSRSDARPETDLDAVREEYDVDVVDGVEVDAEDRSHASGSIASLREQVTLLAVRGVRRNSIGSSRNHRRLTCWPGRCAATATSTT